MCRVGNYSLRNYNIEQLGQMFGAIRQDFVRRDADSGAQRTFVGCIRDRLGITEDEVVGATVIKGDELKGYELVFDVWLSGWTPDRWL